MTNIINNVNLTLDKINKFGKSYVIKPTSKITEKISHTYPYDRTFGNPFVITPKYHIKFINNNLIYMCYKNSAYLIETCSRNESFFILKILDSKLYHNLITTNNVSIMLLKFPEYSKIYNHDNIDKFLNMYFHL